MAEKTARRFVNLQIVRGLAALSVVLYHAALFTSERSHATWIAEVFSGRFGFYGVLTFFVLSGFLMEGAVRRYNAPTFFAHRVVRLFPTYWMVFLIIQGVQVARLQQWQPIPWSALTLLPLGTIYRPLHIEWTMVYELFFYFVCTLLCFKKSVFPWVLAGWGCICAGTLFWFNQYGTELQPHWFAIPFSGWNIGFILGGLAGYVHRKWSQLPRQALLFAGVIAVLLGEAVGLPSRLIFSSFGIATLLLVVVTGRDIGLDGVITRALFTLGEYSYGLYLIHAMTILIILQYVPANRISEPLSLFVGLVASGLIAGIIAGSIDIWIYAKLKRRVDRFFKRRSSPIDNPPVVDGRREGA